MDDWRSFFKNQQKVIRFQSARGEDFWLPLHLSEELAYLLGIIMGDGHLAEYAIYIVDYSEERIQNLAKKMEQFFGADILLYSQEEFNTHNLCQKGKWLVRFVNFITGQIIAGKKYSKLREPLLLKGQANFRNYYWQGMIDSDGSYRDGISFCSSSKELIGDFCSFLESQAVDYGSYTTKAPLGEGYYVAVKAASRKRFAEIIGGSLHPEKKKELEIILERTTGKVGRPGLKPRRKPRRKTGFKTDSYLVEGVRKDRLHFEEGKYYFNYALLPSLQIHGLANWLKNWRKEKGLTQKEMAEILATTQARICSYEKGFAPPISSLLVMVEIAGGQEKLPTFLSRKKIEQFRSQKSIANLPLEVDFEKMAILLKGIRIKGQFIFGSKEQIAKISSFFKVDYEEGKISNAVLKKFLMTFMTLRKS